MKNYDAIIIGAGAAGLMCASVAGQRGRRVLLIEHSAKIAEKIRISGGGRCNFTNLHVTPKNFLSQNPHFVVSCLQRYGSEDFIKLVEKHNISYHEKSLGQLFCDSSSQQIIDMLLTQCKAGSVDIMLETEVQKIEKHEKFILQITRQGTKQAASCDSLIIATGGLSIPKMGATGFGYEVARQFGLKIVETYPALVPLTLEKSMLESTKSLAGVSVFCRGGVQANPHHERVRASLKHTPSFDEALLFTHRGISGPVILQLSSYLKKSDKLLLNMAPSHNIYEIFLSEKRQKPKQEIATILAKYLPKSLAAYIAKNHAAEGWIADCSNQKLQEIANHVNAWTFTPEGSEGYAKAEVTGGGVDTDEISSKTFECKTVPGLYFIGEILDVTGHLGGFNFQFAWSSGHAAGQVA